MPHIWHKKTVEKWQQHRILYNKAVILFNSYSREPLTSWQHHVMKAGWKDLFLSSFLYLSPLPSPELICGFGVGSSAVFCDSWDKPTVNTTNLINTQKPSYFHCIWPQRVASSYQVTVNQSGIYLGNGVTRQPPQPVCSLSVWLSANAWHRPWH